MWWLWVLGALAVWTVAGLAVAVVLGRGIRLADERSPGTGASPPLTTADLPASFVPDPVPAQRRAAQAPRRGAVPLPTVGLALVAVVLGLETGGFISRLTGRTDDLARLLDMDAPFSLPRLAVAALFAAAAFAAAAGAGVQSGRRIWWLAIAVVAAGIATVKAGSTVHAEAVGAATRTIGRTGALAISALLAAVVVLSLFLLSRHERRDRRRVLGALSAYAVAAIGLSAVSGVAGGWGSTWVAAATYVEESGEALAGVAFLMAVLVGVAPQLVLPRDWALRRRADAETLAAVQRPVPGSGPGAARS